MIPGYLLFPRFLTALVVAADCTASSITLSKTHSAHAQVFPSTLSHLAQLESFRVDPKRQGPIFDCTLGET